MNTAQKLLTRLKVALNLPSDYAAAKILGVSSQSLSVIKTGKGGFSDSTLIKIAHLLDENPIKTVCEYHLDIETDDNMRQFYADILESYFAAQSRAVTDEEMREAG